LNWWSTLWITIWLLNWICSIKLNCCDVIVNVVNIVILLRYCDMSLWYCWDIVNMSLRYCDIIEILWYEFETCTGFEFNFFWICTEPICIGRIKSANTNNLILVSAYLTQPIPIYSLLVSAVLGQPIPIMIICIDWQQPIPKMPDFLHPIDGIGQPGWYQ
jgi:hypothetical protein